MNEIMMNEKAKKILYKITDFYLTSRDFNGIPFCTMKEEYDEGELTKILEILLEKELISVVFGDIHPNPHIKAFKSEPTDVQIKKLKTNKIHDSCIYPNKSHLSTVVNIEDYSDRPYTLELALGAPQLDYRSFGLSILEYYRNDPRYYYKNDDIRGWISVTDKHYESDEMPKSDQVLLETFGFSYDDNLNRAVAVFVVYLSRLSPEHQQIWKANELSGDYKLHPDYYRNAILGDWGEGISIFNAFIEELKIINNMSQVMKRPNFFHKDFADEEKPRNFSFLVRPTLSEFNDFCLLLDKMISDNINKSFFLNEVPYENETTRDDDKVIVTQKGTISVLEDWLKKFVKLNDEHVLFEMISTFKKIRKLRQKPAHAIKNDEFDQKYIHQQRELMKKAYTSVKTLRLIFAILPKVQHENIKIPNVIHDGKIWTY